MGEHPRPAVLGVGFPVAFPIIGVEAVRGVGIDAQVGIDLTGRLQRCPHRLDVGLWNALVQRAVEAEDRRVELTGPRDQRLELAVPGDSGANVGIDHRRAPDDRTSPAEAGDTDPVRPGEGPALDPRRGGADVAVDLGGSRLHDDRPDFLHIGERRQIDARAIEESRRDRDIAEPRQPPADVLDIIVDSENLVDDDDRRMASVGGGPRDIGGQRAGRAEGQGGLSAVWGEDKVADYIKKLNANHPVLEKSTFPLAQQVAAGELLVGLGIYHTVQPPLQRGAPIKIVIPDPVSVQMLYDIIPAHAQNKSGGELVALWLTTPEGARAYEDATSRGNPLIEGTKTEALLRGRTIAQYAPEQNKREAEVVERFNKLLESGATE